MLKHFIDDWKASLKLGHWLLRGGEGVVFGDYQLDIGLAVVSCFVAKVPLTRVLNVYRWKLAAPR